MRIPRLLTFSAVIVALFSAGGATVYGQDASGSQGSVKVRPRFFNPFDVGTSQLTLNPFGVFNFAQPFAAPSAADNSSSKPTPVLTEGNLGVSVSGGVRPPFRPRVRSPFRPPPRPPF